MPRKIAGLYQKMPLVDDSELQILIKIRLRDYIQTLSKRAILQLEMLDAIERRVLTGEERIEHYNAAQRGLATLTEATQNPNLEGRAIEGVIISVSPPCHRPPIPVTQHNVDETRQLALPLRVKDRSNLENVAASASSNEAEQDTQESEANSVNKTPPTVQDMPVITVGSQRQLRRLNVKPHYFLKRHPP